MYIPRGQCPEKALKYKCFKKKKKKLITLRQTNIFLHHTVTPSRPHKIGVTSSAKSGWWQVSLSERQVPMVGGRILF